MRILYFDCFSGISGDMAMAALLDLGIDRDAFLKELGKLKLDGYEIKITKKVVNGITGTDVSVILSHNGDMNAHEHDERHDNAEMHSHSEATGHDHDWNHDHNHEHHHDHHHRHHHDHYHGHHHSHEHGHSHGHNHEERNLEDITRIIDESSLSDRVKTFSKAVFKEIAEAEARVHDKAVNEVHFHEVGAVDSIVDIVGTAICMDMLGIDAVYSSELHDGKGTIVCRHGTIPVPVPAVMQMLAGSGIPLISEDIGTELVTPTGMALIKYMSKGFGKMPPMLVQKTGYGMGKRETGRFNALRVVMGEMYRAQPEDDEIVVLETNIDDMSPELLGYAASRLFDAGALDVFYTPIYMKKSRPAFMLTVLSKYETEKKLADIILMETTTLGIRRSTCKRYCMERRLITVDTQYGKVRVKVASMGDFSKAAPEYEDCRILAQNAGVPVAKVYEAVTRALEGVD